MVPEASILGNENIFETMSLLFFFYNTVLNIDKYKSIKTKNIENDVRYLIEEQKISPDQFMFFKSLNFDDTLEFSNLIRKSNKPLKTMILELLENRKKDVIDALEHRPQTKRKIKLNKKYRESILNFIEERKDSMRDIEYLNAMNILRERF